MIAVLAELGGEGLIGKARELADAQGTMVVALVTNANDKLADRCVALGADEVIKVGNWEQLSAAIAILIEARPKITMVIFPSNLFGNVFLGKAYVSVSKLAEAIVMDGVEFLDENEATKEFSFENYILTSRIAGGKLFLSSAKLIAFPAPYEDPSRMGTRSINSIQGRDDSDLCDEMLRFPELMEPPYGDSSSELVLLVGKSIPEKTKAKHLVSALAERSHSRILTEEDSKGRNIYGPCLALEIETPVRDLPNFHGELIALNSKRGTPITQLADLSMHCENVEEMLEELTNQLYK